MSVRLHAAFVLAAGLGTRMRPLSRDIPKPLVPLAGRTLLDRVLDRIADAGIARAVVNVHWLADAIEAHLARRTRPAITVSDERAELLDTGGGVNRALPLLGAEPFLIHNSDTVWIERQVSNLARLAAGFEPERMDALLLLADRATSLGYEGRGDFSMDANGRLLRVRPGETAPHVFAGASIAAPRLFRETPEGPFSLNRVWDRALLEGRLFGLKLDGVWMHVGDPAAHAAAEGRIAGDASA